MKKAIKITEDEWKVIQRRLESFPNDMQLIILGKALAKTAILKAVEKRNEYGIILAQRELRYMQILVKGEV